MANRARMKLVTIVASSEMRDRLEAQVVRLGAKGFTTLGTDGRGAHGKHRRGMFDSGNVRIEAIVAPGVADAMLDYVAGLADQEVVAFAHDVDAVPAAHFA